MRSIRIAAALFAAVVFIHFSSAVAEGASTYTIVSLGALGDDTGGSAADVNASGRAVGWSEGSGTSTAVFWDSATATNMGVSGMSSWARGVNDLGWIVGDYHLPVGSYGYLWQDGSTTSLGTLGGMYVTAEAVNNNGQVTGTSSLTGDSVNVAFRWQSGSMSNLGTLGGSGSYGFDINLYGNVVGDSWTSGDELHAFFWNGSMEDMGTLGGSQSGATAINDLNQVVGMSLTSGFENHAFIWDADTMAMTDLGTLGGSMSWACDVNNSSVVVGRSDTGSGMHAFIWESGVMTDLNTLIPTGTGWELMEAYAVNDSGVIVGTGDFGGSWMPYMLIPGGAPVPLPGAMIMGLVGCGVVAFSRRRLSGKRS